MGPGRRDAVCWDAEVERVALYVGVDLRLGVEQYHSLSPVVRLYQSCACIKGRAEPPPRAVPRKRSGRLYRRRCLTMQASGLSLLTAVGVP